MVVCQMRQLADGIDEGTNGFVVDGWIGALALQGVFDESAVDQGRIVRICHIRRPWNWLASRWRTNRSYIVTRWQPFSRLPAVAAGHAAMRACSRGRLSTNRIARSRPVFTRNCQ